MSGLAGVLRSLDAGEIGVHLPGVAERGWIVDACRRAGKRVVGLDASPRVIITADGVSENGTVRCLKDDVDALVPGAERVLVLRRLGDAPLAATMDAYLDVEMIPGRDVWLEDVT